jgi:hypothetical protein
MAAVFLLIINLISGYFYKVNVIPEGSDIHWTVVKKDFLQEKSGYKYIGAEKCASVCHNNEKMGFQYNSWKKSIHSESFKILASKKAGRYAKKAHITENPQESAACFKCHITGGDLDSSYFTASYKKEEGVTCEACHKQLSDGKTYLPNESDCLKCHNDSFHKMSKFDFKKETAKFPHPRPKVIADKNMTVSREK